MKAIDYTKYGPMEKEVAIGRLPPKPFWMKFGDHSQFYKSKAILNIRQH